VKIVIDVNLSPRWVNALGQLGHEAVHWSSIGKLNAEDVTILEWVSNNGGVLLSCDLDFGTILAATGAHGPSVIQIRGSDVLPELIAERVAAVIIDLEAELRAGVLVSLDMDHARVRVLPLRG
jgi:predicted nuclease of predicted toxin-antitoxin system